MLMVREKDVCYQLSMKSVTLQCWLQKIIAEQPGLLPEGVYELGESSSRWLYCLCRCGPEMILLIVLHRFWI